MRFLRWPANLLRGLFLFLFLLVALMVYGLGRSGLWATVREPELRSRRLARWRGRVLRRSMTMLGATFIKMGQVMSSRPDLLAPETIDELKVLQDRLPAFGFWRVRRIVEPDLGRPVDELFAEFERQPVAAASVAQVHRARLADGTEVAVKVLRPSIRRQVERDATILIFGARLLALSPRLRLNDPVSHLRHFVEAIISQTDLTIEARNYERFAANFAAVPEVVFPVIHPELSSRRVLTMEFMHGTRFDQRDMVHDRALARTIRQMMFKMCFADGFIHADLHPGNFLVREDHRLVVFDVGLAKLLENEILEQFVDFSRCLTMGTADDFVAHIKRFHLYSGELDWAGLRRDVEGLLGRFRVKDTASLEYSALFADIFYIARTYRARPVPDLTLVMVALLTVQGIGKVLDPDNNVFQEVAGYLMPLLAAKAMTGANAAS
ncbi:MAG TPA: AarF/UbiB family protein [Kofleriaceae bacterium]|nr:AarF/UbiB family protein [Kofleriaceae bacterium]